MCAMCVSGEIRYLSLPNTISWYQHEIMGKMQFICFSEYYLIFYPYEGMAMSTIKWYMVDDIRFRRANYITKISQR